MPEIIACCGTCSIRPKEDGGKGGCPRTERYPGLKLLASHDCPVYKRQPQKRPAPPAAQEGLF